MSTILTIVVVIIVVGLLVVAHEFGHFIVAKRNGISVEEFGFGFPPRIKKLFTWKETDFTLNWVPFGGFVKIFGENPEDPRLSGGKPKDSFIAKSRWTQAKVLVAGVFFNMLLAWLLFFVSYLVGVPTLVGSGSTLDKHLKDRDGLVITQVIEDSPADKAGLEVGDIVRNISLQGEDRPYPNLDAFSFTGFIQNHPNKLLSITFDRKAENGFRENSIAVIPRSGILGQDGAVIGVSVATKGTLRLPVHKAVWHGLESSINIFGQTVVGFGKIIGGIFVSSETSVLEQVSGPVGIADIVGDALSVGFASLLFLVGVISINLAVLNLIPFPALDGGRLLILAIEGLRRKPINPKIVMWINSIGFLVLISLLVVVTISDIIKL